MTAVPEGLDPTTLPTRILMAGQAKGKEEHPCALCDKVFKSPQARALHMTRAHKKSRKSNRRASSNGRRTTQKENLEGHVSYLYGKVETIIEYYSHSNGVPFSALAEGVAGLLRHKEGR